MANVKSYANFNTVTFQGRVSNVDIVDGKYGEFLAITVLTNVQDDNTVSVVYNDSSKGTRSLYDGGNLPVGRQVTIVGHLAGVSETYFDKKSGQTMMRKRPQITLVDVCIPKGGLGPMPKERNEAAPRQGMVVTTSAPKEAPVDKTPELVPAAAAYTASAAPEAEAPKPYGENNVDSNGFPEF